MLLLLHYVRVLLFFLHFLFGVYSPPVFLFLYQVLLWTRVVLVEMCLPGR